MVKNYHGGKLLSFAWQNMFEHKLEKLTKILDEKAIIDVYLSAEGKQHITRLVVKNKGKEYVAKEQSDDMYKNIDKSLDSIKKQVLEVKEMYTHARNSKERFPNEMY